ncbi:hypothetical protein DPMN_014818 [Dreissena polymorpha]|uniref:Uncharacterized protein n=1 Tax=Dreissena polymorpha TaxID=45954 RepID=A0A9D4S4Z0_DREPO|nr:hypothetical protein DPMN_014818 [Dreissena polymorpha]
MPYTPLHSKTLCPWEYVHNTDLERFPPVLTIARCKCRKCMNSDHYRCMPVFYAIDVLKKQCIDGAIRWIRKSELISVACTCARPTVHETRRRSIAVLYALENLLSDPIMNLTPDLS